MERQSHVISEKAVYKKMDCNDPILNKYIHISMYIFVWEKLWKDIHQNVNSGYFWVVEF